MNFFTQFSVAWIFLYFARPPLLPPPHNFSNGPSLSRRETNIVTDYDYSQKKKTFNISIVFSFSRNNLGYIQLHALKAGPSCREFKRWELNESFLQLSVTIVRTAKRERELTRVHHVTRQTRAKREKTLGDSQQKFEQVQIRWERVRVGESCRERMTV